MMFWGSKSGISSKYSFSSSATFTSEPWSVYTGRLKTATSGSSNSKVSIFIFDKKLFENYLSNYGIIKSKTSSNDRKLLEEAYDILRNQVNNLARLKHPNILTLLEPLEEHSKNFMFVSEFITGTVETIFTKKNDEEDFLKGHVTDEIVIHRGIFQLVHALDFIHNRTNSVHLDIQPKTIFINENSDWKISGFGHIMKLPDNGNNSTTEYDIPHYDPRVPAFIHLALDYTAPEIVLDHAVSTKSDMFSLGLLMYSLYSKESLLHTENSTSEYKDEYIKFQKKVSTMSWDNVFIKLPAKLRHCIPMLINRDIFARYDNITNFLESEFFQDPMIKTLNFLDDLPTKSNEDKLIFLEGLEELLPQFPVTLLQKKFLAVLLSLLNQLCAERNVNSRCVSLNLSLVIKIGATISQLSFQERILPVLTNKTNFPVLLAYATTGLIDNLNILKEKIKSNEYIENILKPLLTSVLNDMEGETSIVPQEKLLMHVPLILESIDFLTVKKFLLPLISKLFTKTTSLKIKVICVESFETLIEKKTIDSYICCDEVLPLFKSMKSRDSRILMKSLKFFQIVPNLVEDESILVCQLLPLIWSYSLTDTLNSSEYTEFIKVINKISGDIQKVHIGKLEKNTSNSQSNKNFNKIIDSAAMDSMGLNKSSSSLPQEPVMATPAIIPVKKTPTNIPIPVHSSSQPQPQSNPLKKAPTSTVPSTTTYGKPSNTLDGFSDFVGTPSITTPPSTSTPVMSLNRKTDTTSSAKSTLPPGFSVPLQPMRSTSKSAMTPATSTTTSNNNTWNPNNGDSLI
ncbi:hypothetical protein TPHA_0J02290 [Tetrapisispora phaffii CBS 4417]|uniref:Protein kinase domain-containing protein n=1 Tax=Tetrapisispora phaffii (strain ATCC 24235 / CBS 4417 / NBRC 1672 / NRRL Y-8282 / UCD 70-5) TaxID=1071381 RepID=G8BYV7_TETPH|nr:hypothetical protein TPHA_0J02290 [Tetrapisispora phaffii CBS 4417]CCE65049.1 hypothetical protein TPHA_0J02290 [Tetrapisispora phaffii CBS 4417]